MAETIFGWANYFLIFHVFWANYSQGYLFGNHGTPKYSQIDKTLKFDKTCFCNVPRPTKITVKDLGETKN